MVVVVTRRARAVLLAALVLCLVPLVAAAHADASSRAAGPPRIAAAETVTITGSLNAGDVQQAGRVTRDGTTHGCETPTTMPGLENNTALRRDAHNFVNPRSTQQCVVVEADLTGCAGNQVMVIAYSSFNPASPATNVIGASGFSTINKMAFGFRVGPDAPYTLVVHEAEAGTGCPLYRLEVTTTPLAAITSEGHGANAFALAPTVTDFRSALGPPADRREITWDDVPESLADPVSIPADHYNTTQPRGLVFTSPTDVRVSSDGSTGNPTEFSALGAQNAARYQWFSPVRMMSPVGSNIADIAFRVAGTSTPAPTSSFGAVLVSTDGAGYLLPRDAAGDPLGIYVPPAHPSGLTFYGLRFPTPQIHSMSLAADWASGVVNNAVFDDFIYADPGFRVTVATTGSGRVTAAGMDCPGDCAQQYGSGPVTFTAHPPAVGGVTWGGACAGATGPTCVLTPTQSRTDVLAAFTDCTAQQAAVTQVKKAVKKRKAAVGRAKRALAQADRPAEVTAAKDALTKAHKKLKKAKKKLKKARKALASCLG